MDYLHRNSQQQYPPPFIPLIPYCIFGECALLNVLYNEKRRRPKLAFSLSCQGENREAQFDGLGENRVVAIILIMRSSVTSSNFPPYSNRRKDSETTPANAQGFWILCIMRVKFVAENVSALSENLTGECFERENFRMINCFFRYHDRSHQFEKWLSQPLGLRPAQQSWWRH